MGKRLLFLTLCSIFLLGNLTNLYGQTGRTYKVGISVWTGYPTNVKGFTP